MRISPDSVVARTVVQFQRLSFSLRTLCRFGSITVPASFASASSIQCVTPANPPGYITVESSFNLQDFFSAHALFHYDFVSILRLQPSLTSQLGGEEIRVGGVNFMPPDENPLYCIVGSSGASI